jgi:hypothetical protein
MQETWLASHLASPEMIQQAFRVCEEAALVALTEFIDSTNVTEMPAEFYERSNDKWQKGERVVASGLLESEEQNERGSFGQTSTTSH